MNQALNIVARANMQYYLHHVRGNGNTQEVPIPQRNRRVREEAISLLADAPLHGKVSCLGAGPLDDIPLNLLLQMSPIEEIHLMDIVPEVTQAAVDDLALPEAALAKIMVEAVDLSGLNGKTLFNDPATSPANTPWARLKTLKENATSSPYFSPFPYADGTFHLLYDSLTLGMILENFIETAMTYWRDGWDTCVKIVERDEWMQLLDQALTAEGLVQTTIKEILQAIHFQEMDRILAPSGYVLAVTDWETIYDQSENKTHWEAQSSFTFLMGMHSPLFKVGLYQKPFSETEERATS